MSNSRYRPDNTCWSPALRSFSQRNTGLAEYSGVEVIGGALIGMQPVGHVPMQLVTDPAAHESLAVAFGAPSQARGRIVQQFAKRGHFVAARSRLAPCWRSPQLLGQCRHSRHGTGGLTGHGGGLGDLRGSFARFDGVAAAAQVANELAGDMSAMRVACTRCGNSRQANSAFARAKVRHWATCSGDRSRTATQSCDPFATVRSATWGRSSCCLATKTLGNAARSHCDTATRQLFHPEYSVLQVPP
jgi:hypothetical protein